MIRMPILLDCIAAEPCPSGGYIDKAHLIKWILDVLDATKGEEEFVIFEVYNLLDYLRADE